MAGRTGAGQLAHRRARAGNLSGELDVAPTGAVVRAHGLTAARGAVSGQFTIRNQTPALLAVRPRAVPSSRTLDDLLRVELRAGGRRIFEGPLGELRSGPDSTVRLAPGEQRAIAVRARLVRADNAGLIGSREDITLDLRARPVRR